ncbi:cadherin-related family member 5-like isoform X1 [Cololabis saira]|uniref:cadherin-related family member 5-like isoform X1 n=1 Tax=Cololabis saira TaxID=129043 RepID=UPI002AD33C0E|nr:cadherin-related family member 5-like isoform X1 [Cololabis saira]
MDSLAGLGFLLVVLVQTSAVTGQICSAENQVNIAENNAVNAVVTTITTAGPGVTLSFREPGGNPENAFKLEGNGLLAAVELDYEVKTSYAVGIRCIDTETGEQLSIGIAVIVLNLNDNPPVFSQNLYEVSVEEMSRIGTTVGQFPATDLDKPTIYYTLTSESSEFILKSATVPEVLVNADLDYDKVKNVQLVLEAQDTLPGSTDSPSFTATTTISITVTDVDNRPPWFQPCTSYPVGGVLVCTGSGYTGRVVLNELKEGVLPLTPGPVYAIDGDHGIKEAITYSFLSGNEDGLFIINPDTGNITMTRPTDVLWGINLTVMAAQRINSHQYATTSVTIKVDVKSLHPPQFQKPAYEALVTGVGTMAMDPTNKEPLMILATDEDYAAAGGINPHISYSVVGSNDFSIINGYLFMTTDLEEATHNLEILATDVTNDETGSATLVVDVNSGLTTTSIPPSTTDFTTTPPVESTTTGSSSTTSITSESTISTAASTMATDTAVPSSSPSLTTEGSTFTTSAHFTVLVPGGAYAVQDMAALGASLGVLLFVCLVVIGVLAHRMSRGKAYWKKIYEASMFRSSVGKGPGGPKEGIQYTNEAFERDEDKGSLDSGGSQVDVKTAPAWDIPPRSSEVLNARQLPDDASDTSSNTADKEVKPILTKERRTEEGYKSVWFKEDIDPNAKEEVVIIPDSREEDSEEDEEPSSSGREDQDHNLKRSKVGFSETDLDSGLGVKIDDPAEDSDYDRGLNIDL